MNFLNVGCGPFKADGWTNTDIDSSVDPDVVVPDPFSQPTTDGGWDRIYLGHVLEHLEWQEARVFLYTMWKSYLAPGGQLLVVGPDVYRTIQKWSADDGTGSWQRIVGVLEDYEHHQDNRGVPGFDLLRHRWNCYQKRVEAMFRHMHVPYTPAYPGIDMQAYLENLVEDGWPITSCVDDQCAVLSSIKES